MCALAQTHTQSQGHMTHPLHQSPSAETSFPNESRQEHPSSEGRKETAGPRKDIHPEFSNSEVARGPGLLLRRMRARPLRVPRTNLNLRVLDSSVSKRTRFSGPRMSGLVEMHSNPSRTISSQVDTEIATLL